MDEIKNPEGTLAHAQASYANCQDIIKFIDTKTGVIIGLVTLLLGLPLLVVKWLLEQESGALISITAITEQSPLRSIVSLVILIFGIGAELLALINGAWVLLARPSDTRAGTVILFPMFDPVKAKLEATESLMRLHRGLATTDILLEYEVQLYRLGQILHEKVRHLRRSIWCFAFGITLYVIALGLLFIAYIGTN